MVNVFLQASTYKPSQGRIARQATFATVSGIIGLGAWRFSVLQLGTNPAMEYGIPLGILLAGIWIGFRLVHWPKFADFLIAVEAEMNKVSWSTRKEVVASTKVVIITVFLLAIILALVDAGFTFVFGKVGILKV